MNSAWFLPRGNLRGIAVLVLAFLLASPGPSMATREDALIPFENAMIPLQKYSSVRAKALASTYRPELSNLFEHIYYCLPWLAIRKQTLGFPKRVGAQGDDRYLSVMIDVDVNDPDGAFAATPRAHRVSAMLSRYGVHIMRQMVTMTTALSDPNVAGVGVALTWSMPAAPGARPIGETVALFVDTSSLIDFLGGRLPAAEFVNRAKFTFWEGENSAPAVKVDIWEDTFNTTYKLKNYELPKGYKCN